VGEVVGAGVGEGASVGALVGVVSGAAGLRVAAGETVGVAGPAQAVKQRVIVTIQTKARVGMILSIRLLDDLRAKNLDPDCKWQVETLNFEALSDPAINK